MTATLPSKKSKPKPPNAGKGRPKGAKNKTTIFKEAMQQGFERKLQHSFKRVLDAVVHEAENGNMQAAKLLFDRVLPVNEIGKAQKGGGNITIVIGSMEQPEKTYTINAEPIEDAEFEEVG